MKLNFLLLLVLFSCGTRNVARSSKENQNLSPENINIKISDLKLFFEFQKIIFDSSNSYYKTRNWEKECIHSDLKFHNILDKGAFIEYL